MAKQETIVMYDSDEAASIQTLTGWVSRDGRFFGDNEDLARYCGSTHRVCKNNPEHGAHRTNAWCDVCHEESQQEKFAAMPREIWKDEPLVIFGSDTYFFDADDIISHAEEFGILPSEMNLVICEPNYPRRISILDHLEDLLPEDGDDSCLSVEILDAVDALNKAIDESKPISWSQGKVAASVSDDILPEGWRDSILAARDAEKGGNNA